MIRPPPELLTIEQLKRLQQHQYSATGKSFLDPYMQPFWEWVVLQLPEWLAPNLMTILGLLVNVVTCLLLLIMAPDANTNVHPVFFIACGLGLFIYQTLDACDGKQARRTGSSSPLGELFDHGCDAISTIFVVLGACIATKLGSLPNVMIVQCLLVMYLFYCAHWQTFVTGTLRFGKFDVTEVQFTVILVHLISAIFGQDVWSTKVLFFEVRYIPFVGCIIGAVFALFSYLRVCLSSKTLHVCEGSALSPLVPSLLMILPAILISYKSPALMHESPCLYMMTFGLTGVKMTFRIIVSHMTHSELQIWDSTLLTPIVIFFNQYLDLPVAERLLLWVGLVFSTTDLMLYANALCNQICDHFKIELFRITPVTADRKHSADNFIEKPSLKHEPEALDDLSLGQEPPSYQNAVLGKS